MQVEENTEGDRSPRQDERIVLKLLEDIRDFLGFTEKTLPPADASLLDPRRAKIASKLYIDTRDTYDVVENVDSDNELARRRALLKQRRSADSSISIDSDTHDDESLPQGASVADSIQFWFKWLGGVLSIPIREELLERNLSMDGIMHYVRYFSLLDQWIVYKKARIMHVETSYCDKDCARSSIESIDSSLSFVTALTRHAEFIKNEMKKDIDTICVFARTGTFSTIFGSDDVRTHDIDITTKFESLMEEVYAVYLQRIIDSQINALTQLALKWQEDQLLHQEALTYAAAQAVSLGTKITSFAALTSETYFFQRKRKFDMKRDIFPDAIYDWPPRFTPAMAPGGQTLIAHPRHVGIWWQTTVLSVTEQDISILHHDEVLGILNHIESLHGHIYVPEVESNQSFFRRCGVRIGSFSKWEGQRMLLNNGKDSLWIEVVVTEVEDKKCKVELKPGLEDLSVAEKWKAYLVENTWLHIRDFRWNAVPKNSDFRIHIGLKFRKLLEEIQTTVIGISCVFPDRNLERQVQTATWRSLENIASKEEHLYSRYLRAVLQDNESLTILADASQFTSKTRNVPGNRFGRKISMLRGKAIEYDGASEKAPRNDSRILNDITMKPQHVSYSTHGNFDIDGVYQALPDRTSLQEPRTTVVLSSSFEKLTHILLEETEVLSVCIQANNTALARVFVEAFAEKLEKQNNFLLNRLEKSTLEYMLSEVTNAYRFLYAWKICRYELDESTRLERARYGRNSMLMIDKEKQKVSLSSTSPSVEADTLQRDWIDRTFEHMEGMIIDMIRYLTYRLHNQFFYECSTFIFPSIYGQEWDAISARPHITSTYGIQSFLCRIQMIVEFTRTDLLKGFEHHLAVHEKVQDRLIWAILEPLSCVAAFYEQVQISRPRTRDWKSDILYLVLGMQEIVGTLNKMLSQNEKDSRAGVCKNKEGWELVQGGTLNEIHKICLRLILCIAIRTSPINAVISGLKSLQREDYSDETVRGTSIDTAAFEFTKRRDLMGILKRLLRSLHPSNNTWKAIVKISFRSLPWDTNTNTRSEFHSHLQSAWVDVS